MELLRHHMTISQINSQASLVDRYAFDYSLFSTYMVLELLETEYYFVINICVDELRYVS